MGGTQDQESCAFLRSWIWRTVSFQALPKKILLLRNILIPIGLISLGIDAYDSYLYSMEYQWYNAWEMAGITAFKEAAAMGYVYDPATMCFMPTPETAAALATA